MLLALAGAGYGLILAALSIVIAGVGHGTYIPAGMSSAPIGLVSVGAGALGAQAMSPLTDAVPALFGAPVVWGGVGWLLGRTSTPRGRVWFLLAVACHYIVGVGLAFSEEFGGWSYVARQHEATPWILPLWLGVYLAGQVAMWIRYRSSN